jgi:hypothetical protein
MNRARGGLDLPIFPQVFHRLSRTDDPTLSHSYASGVLPMTYTEWNLSGKLKKITQRLYFGYCLDGFRKFIGKKCENRTSVVSVSWLVVTFPSIQGL